MKILMISTEYPPMQGGVGHYSKKLVDSLRSEGVQVYVACNEDGKGEFNGISPNNNDNSKVLLKIVKEIEPDVVHVQYEPGLYGIYLDPINPGKTHTNIESFYDECKVPVVTTFHSAYTFTQWMRLVVPLNNSRFGRVGTFLRMAYDYWTHLVNYGSFNSLNRRKIGPNKAGVVFSKYLANIIPGSSLIYHGAEPSISPPLDRKEARKMFLLPEDTNIALAVGFMTATKGWDVIGKMKVPEGWKVVINTSRNHYGRERLKGKFENQGVINLNRGFLSDRDLSLLLYCADALILPYKVASGSGVMYDGLAHGLPFISSKIEFFKEFSDMGLGISVDRNPVEFSKALLKLKVDYKRYKDAVMNLRKNLLWKEVANKHILLYNSIINRTASPLISTHKKNH
ncbi:MAG TPA: glycosyltransferase [Nitrososphaeraceae archaeon]|jgi:glycosyltransferase involved in cell wall biosynthesis|nr:glycosyltransferase [Nitrososphaeraceae archaeon]